MPRSKSRPVSGRQPHGRLLAGALTFFATLAAAPGYAVVIPNIPLQSQAEYPPANVRFILDDSGSMNLIAMPAVLSDPKYHSGTGAERSIDYARISDASYVHNTIYYNPTTTYQPWIKADGTRYPDASYTSAARDTSHADSDWVNLADSTQIFYVPKVASTTSANAPDYYRYEIPVGGADVVRYEGITPSPFPKTGLRDTSGSPQHRTAFTVPAGVHEMTVMTSGGTHGNNGAANNNRGDGADLYVRFNNADVTSSYNCRSQNGANDETCVIRNPAQGTWYVGLTEESSYRNVTMTVALWSNATSVRPTGRTVGEEVRNYANWYTYHRSRMKVAKAGASEAMSRIGDKLRLGIDTINRNTTGIPYDIPVTNDDGLFRGSNKSTWYDRLQQAEGDNTTPLHRALQRAGDYFSRSDANGPWGPQAGAEQISCRQNFAILTTDGYWNNTDDFTSVGDADGTAGVDLIDPTGTAINTYEPKNPYKDNFVEVTGTNTQANTLADVAMYYWKRDLRPYVDDANPGLKNNVPYSTTDTPYTDPAFWQHMTTFGVSIGLKGTLDPSSTVLDQILKGTMNWTDPIHGGENADRIDDLWHASVNGRGRFVVAGNSKEFTDGLLAAFARVAEAPGSASNVTANSTSFITNTRVYQASYISGKWSGELAAYNASSAGVEDLPYWSASKLIPTSGRTILTWNGSSGTAFPTAEQISLLDQGTRVNGTDNAAYIKGDRSKERPNGQLRVRDSVLGDIVNSSPMYIRDSETIFVGANDGMMHAFNALTGEERFAYVPGGIDFQKLATLSNPQYSHEYFVDGPIVVSTKTMTPGKNYLVGTLGRGGKGVYALDVTDPTKFGITDVLWERTAGANMGYVLGEPMITTLNGGTNVAIFGNGINSASGHAVLYVVDLQSGAVLQEIDTGAGADNGLSSPRGWDQDGNGTVDFVFAGDLKGNVWKFDFSKGATGKVAFDGKPLFTTESGQPITADLGLAINPQTGERWVFVGSGSLLSKADLTDSTIQSMYALIDDGSDPITRSQLQQRTIDVVEVKNGVAGNRAFEPNAPLPSGKRGWYLNLSKPTPGERVVNRPLIDGSALFFASIIPPTSNACDVGGKGYLNALDAFTGTSLKNPFFDADGNGVFDNGDTLSNSSGQKVAVGSMDPGIGMLTKPIIIRGPNSAIAVVGGSQGGRADPLVNPPGSAPQRVSWREILRN